MSDFVESLEFEKIKIGKTSNSYTIVIYFTLIEKNYLLQAFKEDGMWNAYAIFHTPENECIFCKTSNIECFTLENYQDEILNHLLNHPNVRLKRLFL